MRLIHIRKLSVVLAMTVLLASSCFVLTRAEESLEQQIISQSAKNEKQDENKSVTPAAKAKMLNPTYADIDVMSLAKKPEQFKEQYVSFGATFNSFSTLGLDYPKANRSSEEYISVVVLRPDVGEHHIPMSEVKLFFPRKESDSVLELESGDQIMVKGHVFSTALNDPWVDITELTIVQKAATKKVKK